MNSLAVLLFTCFAAQCSFAQKKSIDYNAQGDWPGECTTGNQQSPLRIATRDVVVDPSLSNLQFNAWDVSYSGVFKNTGHNVQFTPDNPGAATTINQFGTYDVQQFHMHWGGRTGKGSEHIIDNDQAEIEIHFVHFKKDVTDKTQRDYISVVAILGDVDEDASISSPWDKLSVTQIQSNATSGIPVTSFKFEQLLPKNRDYYYYQGSLTAPLCSEIVQWFVLKERISVPSTFLDQLRMVQAKNGSDVKFNFRDVQALGDRVVMTASQTINKPFIGLLILTLSFLHLL